MRPEQLPYVKETNTKPKGRDGIVAKPPKQLIDISKTQPATMAYELRKVLVNGVEVLARPVQWDGKDYNGHGVDRNGKQIGAIAYTSTCPKCSQLMQFTIPEILKNKDGNEYVICNICKGSTTPPKPELKQQPKEPEFPKFSDPKDIAKLKEELKPKPKNIPANIETKHIVQGNQEVVVNLPSELKPPAPKPQEAVSLPPGEVRAPVQYIEYESDKKDAPEEVEGFRDPIRAGKMKLS